MNDNLSEQCVLWMESLVEYFASLIYTFFSYLIFIVEVLPSFHSILTFLSCTTDTLTTLIDLSFSDFQVKLLQVFFCILSIHIVAICIAWKIYSARITQRFLIPSCYQISNELLKTAVSELKLPAEHTPRW